MSKNTEMQELVDGVIAERPEWLEKGNAGSEEVTTSDRVLPRVDVLQALSPQIKKSDPNYIEGAEQGKIFNTVTKELYGDEIVFIPVYFRKEFVLWKLRKHGGGFIGAFQTQAEANSIHCEQQVPSEYEVVESHQHFVILLTNHGPEEAVLSMTKSKLRVSRSLNSLIQIANVDRFAKAYKLRAIESSSDKGDFWSYNALPAGFVSKDMYEYGKGLYELIKAGAADVDRSVHEAEAAPTGQTYESAEL